MTCLSAFPLHPNPNLDSNPNVNPAHSPNPNSCCEYSRDKRVWGEMDFCLSLAQIWFSDFGFDIVARRKDHCETRALTLTLVLGLIPHQNLTVTEPVDGKKSAPTGHVTRTVLTLRYDLCGPNRNLNQHWKTRRSPIFNNSPKTWEKNWTNWVKFRKIKCPVPNERNTPFPSFFAHRASQ